VRSFTLRRSLPFLLALFAFPALATLTQRRIPLSTPALAYSTYIGGDGTNVLDIAVDPAGNSYLVGTTTAPGFPIVGGIPGPNNGFGFLMKLNPSGSAIISSTRIDASISNVAVDASGAVYLAGGSTTTSPTTPGAAQPASGRRAWVAKVNPAGSSFVYATGLGGSTSGTADQPGGIAVDAAGNAWVTGTTFHTDFPTTPGAFDTAYSGGSMDGDAFVTKVNATGTAFLYSTYLGGSASESAGGIAVDAAGNAYVTGGTNSVDFPTTPGSYQPVYVGGTQEGYVSKFTSAGALAYSTFLGRSNSTFPRAIAVDLAGNAYVAGDTNGSDFPVVLAAQPTYNGAGDGFVSKLNTAGSALVYSTFVGGTQGEFLFGVAVDSAGHAFVTGSTGSSDFPVANPIQPALAGSLDATVTVLSATGSAFLFSTYLGGNVPVFVNALDRGLGIAVGPAGSAYFAGTTESSDFPTTGGSLQRARPAGTHVMGFAAKISAPVVDVFADLAITIAPSGTTMSGGATAAWTVTVTNNGPSSATGVTATTTLPPGFVFGSATPSQGTCSGTSVVTCNAGSLASGASATVVITLTAPATASNATISTIVTAAETDPLLANNTASASVVVTVPVPISRPSLLLLGVVLTALALVALRSGN